jgi:hypothetical protein
MESVDASEGGVASRDASEVKEALFVFQNGGKYVGGLGVEEVERVRNCLFVDWD